MITYIYIHNGLSTGHAINVAFCTSPIPKYLHREIQQSNQHLLSLCILPRLLGWKPIRQLRLIEILRGILLAHCWKNMHQREIVEAAHSLCGKAQYATDLSMFEESTLPSFFVPFPGPIKAIYTLEVQGLKKNVLMKIRRKWIKKERPCKILMMYLLRSRISKGTLL